jgi:HSP20 family protein
MLTLWRNHETPFTALSREVDRLLNEAAPRNAWNGYGLVPAAFQVVVDLPGLDPKAIQISVQEGTLAIQSERKLAEPAADATVHRSERPAGTFFRSFALPSSVDATKVEAKYENGVLTVVLPKREEAKPRTIQVNVK